MALCALSCVQWFDMKASSRPVGVAEPLFYMCIIFFFTSECFIHFYILKEGGVHFMWWVEMCSHITGLGCLFSLALAGSHLTWQVYSSVKSKYILSFTVFKMECNNLGLNRPNTDVELMRWRFTAVTISTSYVMIRNVQVKKSICIQVHNYLHPLMTKKWAYPIEWDFTESDWDYRCALETTSINLSLVIVWSELSWVKLGQLVN